MNAEPHSHRLDIRDHGYFWGISYGDRNDVPSKPARFPWDSEEAYAKRCAHRLRGHIARIVRKHDDVSRVVLMAQPKVPEFRPDAWGSEQL